MREKIKTYMDIIYEYLIYIIIIFVAFSSFGLGRISVNDTQATQNNIQVVKTDLKNKSAIDNLSNLQHINNNKNSGNLVASVRGTKYHHPWCSGAQRIKEENKIWFTNSDDARSSGYTPASNCKGLE